MTLLGLPQPCVIPFAASAASSATSWLPPSKWNPFSLLAGTRTRPAIQRSLRLCAEEANWTSSGQTGMARPRAVSVDCCSLLPL